MRQAQPFFDVFLSASKLDLGLAAVVRSRLEEAGLTVYIPEREPEQDSAATYDHIREAVANARTFVVVLTPVFVNSANLAVESGGAWVWNKPTFLLLDGMSKAGIPVYLRRHQAFPMSKLSRAVATVARAASPLSEPDLKRLFDLYQQVGIPTHRLATEPDALDTLTQKFNASSSTSQTPERLLMELMRLRKQSRLPRLRKPRVQPKA